MRAGTLVKSGITAITIGGALVVVSTQVPTLASAIPAILLRIGFIAGWVISVFGILMVLAGWALGFQFPELLPESGIRFRHFNRSELVELLKYAKNHVGQVPTLRTAKKIFKITPNAFYVAERQRALFGYKISRCVGMFSLLPLTRAAVSLLEDGNLDALRFTSEHIATSNDSTAALYVGTVIGDGKPVQGQVVAYLMSLIDQRARDGIAIVYTRPITNDGLKLARRYEFEPVEEGVPQNELGHVYKREFVDFALPAKAEHALGKIEIAPNCPSCNKLMIKRTARFGARAGKQFWGCPQFPKCRGIINIE